MNTVFDVAVIGAGVVGAAIARELSRYELSIALVEANPDVGMGTSKASTAIWHTGFDANPGSLEARLMRRSYALMEAFLPQANIAHERLGAILIAWNPEQLDALPALLEKAHENGVGDVRPLSASEIYEREPAINPGALGGLFVPGEGILCTYSVPLACAYQAVYNGAQLFLEHRVQGARREADGWRLDDDLRARYVVNAAGLASDEIDGLFGHKRFKVTPRRGQLIVFDKLARPLVNHVLLPVPTSVTKGVLISPTVYGNVLLGPTAEDLPDKGATETTAAGLAMLLEKGRAILPRLLDEEVTAAYSGLRAATEHSDYQIEMHAGQNYLCVGGIRSTGVSAALGIAEYAAELLGEAGLVLRGKAEFRSVKMPAIGEAGERPYQSRRMIAQNPAYAEIVCHCERVSRAELQDALRAPIPAPNLDGLRRRTRAMQGRCQGFNCHAALLKTLEAETRQGVSVTTRSGAEAEDTLFDGRGTISHAPALRTDVLIVGAGPAGLSTAIELKRQGVHNVLVVEREPEAGGMPRLCHHTGFGRADLHRLYSGPRYARHYRERALGAGVEIRTSTTITGWNESSGAGGLRRRLNFTSPAGPGEIEAGAVLLATGVRERPRAARLVPGTRPQGIFTTGSLQRFVYQEHLPVGRRALIIGAELVSLSALLTLIHAGVKCVAMVTEQPRHQVYFPYLPMKWGLADIWTRTPVISETRVSEIFGRARVEAVQLTRNDGQSRILECDTLIFSGDWIPEHEMARLGGLAMDAGTRGPSVDGSFRSSVRGVFAAGNLLRGVATADACALEGQAAAGSIVQYLRTEEWPARNISIQVVPPLLWICPNVVPTVQLSMSDKFRFAAREFRKNAQITIQQGESQLGSTHISELVVNDIMFLDGGWQHRVDPAGPPIQISLAN
jgi:glycerol-3-phosphate dehydrogenase